MPAKMTDNDFAINLYISSFSYKNTNIVEPTNIPIRHTEAK